MRQVQNTSNQPQLAADDQMDGMQMDVDNEDVGNNLDQHMMNLLDQQMLLQPQPDDACVDGVHMQHPVNTVGGEPLNPANNNGGTNSGLQQYNQIRQQAAIVNLENSQLQYMASFSNSMGTAGSMSKHYKTNVSSSQKNRHHHVNQQVPGAPGSNSGSAGGAQIGVGNGQNNRNANHSGSVHRRQPSHEDSSKIHIIEGSGGQSIR